MSRSWIFSTIKKTFYLSENGVQTDLVVGRLKGETAKVDILDKEGNVLVAKR